MLLYDRFCKACCTVRALLPVLDGHTLAKRIQQLDGAKK